MNRRIPRVRARTAAALATAAGVAAFTGAPAAANASLLAPASCAPAATTQAFSQWGDASQYTLVPGGTFAGSATGWTLTGGARVVTNTTPWSLGGYQPAGSLYLPAGATAQSPLICVDAQDPTYRLLDASGAGNGVLGVQAVYRTLLGVQLPLTLSPVASSPSWSPTGALPTAAAPVSVISGGTAQLSLRFTAGPGGAYIDDVWVDPLMHR